MSNLTEILLKRIASENLSIPEVLEIIEHRKGAMYEKMKTLGEIDLPIDYRLSLEQMIAAGNYDRFGDLVTSLRDINEKNFPLPTDLIGNIITVPIKLFSFESGMDPARAAMVMAESGYRPGLLPELLALGALLPDLQRNFVIIASGSVWNGHDNGWSYIPCLNVHYYERRLSLNSLTCIWMAGCRFLGVKIIS